MKSAALKPRGILNPRAGEKHFHLSLRQPSPDLSYFIEHYWIIHWDLRGQEPYVSENLPHPCVHLVFEKGQTAIFGVVTGKFTRRIEGLGGVFGIKFRPGAFYPFVKTPISQFTDKTVSLSDIFGLDGAEIVELETAILTAQSEDAQVELAELFLRERLPVEDDNVALINQIIDLIIAFGEVTRVDDVVSRFHIGKRTLQRLFSQYVGVSPKWVIKRYRLQQAADQLAAGEVVDWPRLALDLGYFDQAHFIKDFKTIVGQTPAEYAKKAAGEAQQGNCIKNKP
jgi:AraC-like DNA-binding protein